MTKRWMLLSRAVPPVCLDATFARRIAVIAFALVSWGSAAKADDAQDYVAQVRKTLSISLLGDTLRLRGAHVVLFRADANCCSKNCPLPTFHSFRPLSALHGLTCPCCV